MALNGPVPCPSSIETGVISSTLLTPLLLSQAQLHGKSFMAENDVCAHIQKVKKMAEEHPSLMVCINILVYLSTLSAPDLGMHTSEKVTLSMLC